MLIQLLILGLYWILALLAHSLCPQAAQQGYLVLTSAHTRRKVYTTGFV